MNGMTLFCKQVTEALTEHFDTEFYWSLHDETSTFEIHCDYKGKRGVSFTNKNEGIKSIIHLTSLITTLMEQDNQ